MTNLRDEVESVHQHLQRALPDDPVERRDVLSSLVSELQDEVEDLGEMIEEDEL